MRFVVIVMMLAIPLISSAKDKVWYCQEVASAGLKWENGSYQTATWKEGHFVIKQIGGELHFPKEFGMSTVTCQEAAAVSIISCGDYANRFLLNTKTGKATFSMAIGWVADNARKDDMKVSALMCETS